MHGNSKEARNEKAMLAEQGLKKCGICKRVKPYEDFTPIGSSIRWPGDGYQNHCRECGNIYARNRKHENVKLLQEKKLESGCIICGYDENPTLLHFHHRNPDEKLFNISCQSNDYGLQDLLDEAAKCDVLCRPCHIEHHLTSKEI